MCGIAGEITFDGTKPNLEALDNAVRELHPRGPDASGSLVSGDFSFGHTRLSIIDLSEGGAQPMDLPELKLKITYNGEIYNYQEIRSELEAAGFSFRSTSDTEVLATAYRHWGEDCVQRFNGMFAFVIFDEKNDRFFVARDRLGIKPLYYSQNGHRLIFASNIKSLLQFGNVDTSIDKVALHNYMSLHAIVPEPRTILNGVKKVPAAHCGFIDKNGSIKFNRYWLPKYGKYAWASKEFEHLKNISVKEWEEETLKALRKSVARRLVADVPVGLFLSGGVDSSLLAALIYEQSPETLKTFSVGFHGVGGEEGNEFKYSDLVAEKYSTHHTKIEVSSKEILENLADCVSSMNEPMVSYDNIGFYLLSKKSSESVKVVQSGQGADEVFAGYHWYEDMLNSNGTAVETYREAFFDRSHNRLREVLNADWVGEDYTGEFLKKEFGDFPELDPVTQALRLDTHTMLVEDPIKRVDSNTMRWGLEARVPFLDHELIELAAAMPVEAKIQNGELKAMLKVIAEKFVPKEVLYRPKGYFPVPELKRIQGPFRDFVMDYVNSSKFKDRGLFNSSYVDALSNDPEKYVTKLRGNELWQVASLEIWLSENGL